MVNSRDETAGAFAGLVATALAWGGYLGLRLLGERHAARPDVGAAIRHAQERRKDEPDYSI